MTQPSSRIATERPYAVLGAGVSGRAAAAMIRRLGGSAKLFDEAAAEAAPHLDRDVAATFEAVVISPGFPSTHPWRVAAIASRRPVFGETGFAASLWRGRILGVTGTNGKTTMTELLAQAYDESGRRALAVGNIGRPLSEQVGTAMDTADTIAVCELSSFQAEIPRGLELDGLLWTQFAEDHLDRYGDMRTYFEAKMNAVRSLRVGAPLVAGESVVAWAAANKVGLPPKTRTRPLSCGHSLAAASPLAVGPQRENFALALCLWQQLGDDPAPLFRAAANFELSAHRCQRVADINGVEFWDDSKATNCSAALAALARFDQPVFWIVGGQPKGGDLSLLPRGARGRARGIYVYGDVAPRLARSFEREGLACEVFGPLEAATEAAARAAEAAAPAVVLLSPGFASFDQHAGYADRGKSFIDKVLSLYRSAPNN